MSKKLSMNFCESINFTYSQWKFISNLRLNHSVSLVGIFFLLRFCITSFAFARCVSPNGMVELITCHSPFPSNQQKCHFAGAPCFIAPRHYVWLFVSMLFSFMQMILMMMVICSISFAFAHFIGNSVKRGNGMKDERLSAQSPRCFFFVRCCWWIPDQFDCVSSSMSAHIQPCTGTHKLVAQEWGRWRSSPAVVSGTSISGNGKRWGAHIFIDLYSFSPVSCIHSIVVP